MSTGAIRPCLLPCVRAATQPRGTCIAPIECPFSGCVNVYSCDMRAEVPSVMSQNGSTPATSLTLLTLRASASSSSGVRSTSLSPR
eukprot:13106072-Alexandrium_andersonii.AAC.1